jgi:O-antigen ligase
VVYFWLVTLVFLISLFSLFVSDYWKEIPFLDKNIRERFSLIMSTKDVFIKHPVFGVGLNNFILKTSYTFDIKAINYQLQPVHNIYLLVLSELGFFGFLFFYLTLLKIAHVASLILKPWFFLALTFVIISGVADHYWLTLTQNRLALVFLVSGIFQERDGKRKNNH